MPTPDGRLRRRKPSRFASGRVRIIILAQGERHGALAAVRIVVVHEAVGVVILAVAADLDHRGSSDRCRRGGSVPGPRPGGTAHPSIGCASQTPSVHTSVVQASLSSQSAAAAQERQSAGARQLAAPGVAADVDSAGVAVGAVRLTRAGRTGGRGPATAHAANAEVDRAEIVVRAVGRSGAADRAGRTGCIRAHAGGAGVDRAGVAVGAIGGGDAGPAPRNRVVDAIG